MPHPPEKRISQSQIAREVGCSQALVSMALNGLRKGISDTTYNRILEIARNQGYAPRGMTVEKMVAHPPRQRNTVGYLLRSPLKLATKSNFFSHVHQGLHEYLNLQQIKTVYIGSEDDLAGSESSLGEQVPDYVGGIAIMGEVEPAFLAKTRTLNLPVVYISARASGSCHSVLSNERAAARLLVEHLHDLGHRRFAWLGGGKPAGRRDDRLNGLQAALREHGLAPAHENATPMAGADRLEGYQAASQLLSGTRKRSSAPTAWICLNGLMARGAINYLLQNGISVGQEVSVAAFDMTRVCEDENPSITSAGALPEDMGQEAGRILLNAMRDRSIPLTDLTLPVKLAIRESTGRAKGSRKRTASQNRARA